MTISKDKVLKITALVEGEEVGGKLVVKENYEQFSALVDALNNQETIYVKEIGNGESIYKAGSVFDHETDSFVEDQSEFDRIHAQSSINAFALISNSVLLYVDLLETPIHDALIAAYQSSPTFTIEEMTRERRV